MRELGAREGGVSPASADAGARSSAPPAGRAAPSGHRAGRSSSPRDELMEDVESFLDGWEPEWPLNLDEDGSGGTGARPWGAEAQAQGLCRRDSGGGITRMAAADNSTCNSSAGSPIPGVRAPSTRKNDKRKASTSAADKKHQSPSNTWRQRQRLEVLELRETAKTLARRLQQLKLDQGIRSTLPLDERVRMAGERETDKSLVEATGNSWSEIAKRESLARMLATTENARLHSIISSQTVYARKLQRTLRQMIKDNWTASALRLPRNIQSLKVQRRPKDNAEVFTQLLSGLDDSYAAADKVLEACEIKNLPCPGQASHTWVDDVQGIQAQILDRYRVPFDDQSTTRAVWQVMCGRPSKPSGLLYAEYFDFDSSTCLVGRRMNYSTGSLSIELLLRVAVRKYVEDNRTVFIQHQSVVATLASGLRESSTDVTTRVLKGGELRTHVLGTYPCHTDSGRFMPESLARWQHSLQHFNHTVEDEVLASTNHRRKKS